MTLSVDLTIDYESTDTPSLNDFKQWTHATLQFIPDDLKAPYTSVSIVIMDEQHIAQLNKKYRHKTGPTNVLSFDYANGKHHIPDYLGDIILCTPVIMNEAKQQQKRPLHHWAHMTIHGLLHLMGFNHTNQPEAETMEALEIAILHHLDYPNPYTERK